MSRRVRWCLAIVVVLATAMTATVPAGARQAGRQRVSAEDLFEVLPSAAEVGATGQELFSPAGTVCGAPYGGPDPSVSAGWVYLGSDGSQSLVYIEAFANKRAAKRAMLARKRAYRRLCRGHVDENGYRLTIQGTPPPVRGFGQRRFSMANERRADGTLVAVGIYGGIQTGRYVVFHESVEPAFDDSSADGDRARLRDILRSVEANRARLP